MIRRLFLTLSALVLLTGAPLFAQETFVGSFAEPQDGGNLDTTHSTFDGSTVLIVPRAHASEAVNGGSRWRNVLFAIRGVRGLNPAFVLPLVSPVTGKMVLSGDSVSFQNIKLVWSYQPNAVKWNSFDAHLRAGTNAATWRIEARNSEVFDEDVVYVSINERFPVADFYEWLEADVFTDPMVSPTPSEATAGTFVIGYQSGAPASAAFSRTIPDMPLFGFVIHGTAGRPKKLVMLVSGQHPYEGQNKVALQAAVDWILHSLSPEAVAYRAQYTTVVYPFVNPTGELAGLWRGTAFQPMVDTNRNWRTTETVPSRNRGIDTVIVHKNAMKKDIAALGLGEPYALFDYHQNFGDRPGKPDYLLHSSASDSPTAPVSRRAASTDFIPYYGRIAALTGIAQIASDLTSEETLRGLMTARGVTLPLTFERSVYNTIAGEWTFGVATVQALVDPATIVTAPDPAPDPVVTTDPEITPGTAEPVPVLLMVDDFTGSGTLHRRTPDGYALPGQTWSVETGTLKMDTTGNLATTNTARASIETMGADVEITGVLNLGAEGTGLILRSVDRANFLRFTLFSNGWAFQRTVAGVTTTVAKGRASYPLKANYTMRALLSGPSVILTIDGVTVRTITEYFNEGATRHGLLCSNTGLRTWDSFSVRKL